MRLHVQGYDDVSATTLSCLPDVPWRELPVETGLADEAAWQELLGGRLVACCPGCSDLGGAR